MKLLLMLCAALVAAVSLAQPVTTATYQTSPNLVPATSGTWSNTVTGAAGGTSGGPVPAFNPSTNTIIFSYTQQTAAYTYAFNQALQNAGLAIGGYDYSWKINNSGMNSGTLSGKFTLNGVNGTALQTYQYSYNNSTGDADQFVTYSGTQWFPQNHSSSSISGFTLSWTGQDNRFWAGYWGPRVREPSIQLRYLADPCAADPLSSPSCPGYAVAYQTQQCAANPLYATTCPGYAAAYQTQQCSINTTYNPSCPGYAEAYKTQQCSLNALYATDCPGYEQAYLNAQCIKDSLYSRLCSGYATAYAIKYLTPMDSSTSSAVNSSLSTTAAVKASDPVSVTGNATVDSVLAAPSTTSATSVTSVTSVVNAPPPPQGVPSPTAAAAAQAATPPPPPPAQQAERQADQKRSDSAVATVERRAGGNRAEAGKQVAAAARDAAEKSQKAATLEAQAANQGIVVGLMGYVPGFSAYQNALVPDVLGLQVARQYSKPTVDNRSAQRQLSGSNEYRWREMVDSQYRGK